MKSTSIADRPEAESAQAAGEAMYQFVAELYPICRSITGNGFRETLQRIRKRIPLTVHEVPTGTRVFDWTVPKEWNITDAYVKNSRGERIIDFRKSNLHVVGYSTPVRAKMSLKELRTHLFSLPEHPDWVPYRTSYYNDNWGFCLSQNQLATMEDDEYEVVIDASLADGHLTYGELYLRGEESREVLVSTHACHPSLCNDNLSGVVLTTFLAKHLGQVPLRYSYRFLFVPGTIGAITWLCLNEDRTPAIQHGLVIACVGDRGRVTYKKSRRPDAEIDRAAVHVLQSAARDFEVLDFAPDGYDERQYCSPGFNLPVGCMSRTPHGRFAEYHSSADDLDFVEPAALADSLSVVRSIVDVLEGNRTYVNTNPKCEPQLGKRGLYRAVGGPVAQAPSERALMWVLNMSDGSHSLLDIAERSGLGFELIRSAARTLAEHGLLA